VAAAESSQQGSATRCCMLLLVNGRQYRLLNCNTYRGSFLSGMGICT